MINVPSGIVMFLFTDTEGSTGFSQEYPDEFQKSIGETSIDITE